MGNLKTYERAYIGADEIDDSGRIHYHILLERAFAGKLQVDSEIVGPGGVMDCSADLGLINQWNITTTFKRMFSEKFGTLQELIEKFQSMNTANLPQAVHIERIIQGDEVHVYGSGGPIFYQHDTRAIPAPEIVTQDIESD